MEGSASAPQILELKKDDIWSARISKITKKKLLEHLDILGLDAQGFLEEALTFVRPNYEKPDPKLLNELSEADLLIGRLTTLLHSKI
ncbi:MAG: hypothetical protein K2X39_00975, partial [Silvanigrellaceae bacterium]|nr:hypothetical protein [Silvanigrellaceae bacterium]